MFIASSLGSRFSSPHVLSHIFLATFLRVPYFCTQNVVVVLAQSPRPGILLISEIGIREFHSIPADPAHTSPYGGTAEDL